MNNATPTARHEPRRAAVRTHADARGKLGIIEALPDAGFPFKRLYFLYDVKGDASRGHHAHKALWQYMVALHGTLTICLKARGKTYEYQLERPDQGLIIPPGYWRELSDFSADAVCLVAASEEYDEADYIRDYAAFTQWEESHA